MLPPPPPPPMPASPTLLLMVGFGVVCRPSPTALSAVRIYQPPPSCDRRCFRRRAAVPFCLPSPATVLSLFYGASIAFPAPIDGWLLHSPSTQQHTNHITKPKMFPFSTLLAACVVTKYLVSTNSYAYVGVCFGNRSHRHDADSQKIG